jgi:hypothetical protein
MLVAEIWAMPRRRSVAVQRARASWSAGTWASGSGKICGVSVTTVSHALNGKGRVDPQTRALVTQVVHRLGYRANRHARGLRSGRSGTLGLLLPVSGDVRTDETLRLDYYMRLAGAAATAAFAREHALMLLPPVIGGAGSADSP